MPTAGFKLAIQEVERRQAYAFDLTATGSGKNMWYAE